MLKTTQWVRDNWGEFKALIEEQDQVVVLASRGRLVAAAMSPDRWDAAKVPGEDRASSLVRKSDHQVRQELGPVVQAAKRGVATVSVNRNSNYETLVVAPLTVLDDAVREEYERQAKYPFAGAPAAG